MTGFWGAPPDQLRELSSLLSAMHRAGIALEYNFVGQSSSQHSSGTVS